MYVAPSTEKRQLLCGPLAFIEIILDSQTLHAPMGVVAALSHPVIDWRLRYELLGERALGPGVDGAVPRRAIPSTTCLYRTPIHSGPFDPELLYYPSRVHR